MQDFSQLPSKTVTEVLMLEVRRCHIHVENAMKNVSWISDENVAGGQNVSHLRLPALHAGRCWVFGEGKICRNPRVNWTQILPFYRFKWSMVLSWYRGGKLSCSVRLITAPNWVMVSIQCFMMTHDSLPRFCSTKVVLSLAKMELDNFFKSVMPVADYFDQSDMLVAVRD